MIKMMTTAVIMKIVMIMMMVVVVVVVVVMMMMMMVVLENNMERLSKVAEAVMLLTYVSKMPGSNFSWDISYPD
jgi:flagellar basal body-associated protein FliL